MSEVAIQGSLFRKMNLAPPDGQLELLDCPPTFDIKNNASARNAYGTAAQEIACAALALTPIRINGNYEVCFDAKRGEVFYEIKSCRRTSKVVVWKWRIEKERKTGVSYRYAIVTHNAPKIRDGGNLFGLLNQRGIDIFMIEGWKIGALALQQPLKAWLAKDPLHGSNRVGYREGYYCIPMKQIRECCTHIAHHDFWLHDVLFSVRIHA
jgi:hypothetical protein